MTEPIDVYSDQFQVSIGPFGCTLNFLMSDALPSAPGQSPKSERLASVRMSTEHLKVMCFILSRQIKKTERDTHVKAEVPLQILNSLQISPEDWDAFWKS